MLDAETDERLSALARATNQLRSFLVVPLARQEGVVGALIVGFCDAREFGPEELPLLTTIGGQIAIALQNAEAYDKLDRMYLETVTALAAAMEAKDQYTASHADSLAAMAVAVGSRMGLTDAELRMLQYAAVLHDIGKIGIPGNILNKPEPLTREEFETMAQHTIIGERIISRIDYLVPIARIIRSAHERWDGAGYPDGFTGDEIPLASRILLVCDAFDAMTTDRPYRAALPVDECPAGTEPARGLPVRPARRRRVPRVVPVRDSRDRPAGRPPRQLRRRPRTKLAAARRRPRARPRTPRSRTAPPPRAGTRPGRSRRCARTLPPSRRRSRR